MIKADLAMKTLGYICLLLVALSSASAASDDASNTNPEIRFKACYHRWVAAIYDHPGTLLSSSSGSYTQFCEYDKIVELGPSALPAMAQEIEGNGEMAMFLHEAILKITGWKPEDFGFDSLQARNRLLVARLRAEKLIPLARQDQL